MKRIIFIIFGFLMMFSSFAEISLQKLTAKIEKAGCFVITETGYLDDTSTTDKYPVRIFYDSNERFLENLQIGPSAEICEGKSIEDIKSELKKGTNIYGHSYSTGKPNFQWLEGRHAPISIMYTQSRIYKPIDGAGNYVFKIFCKGGIYSISLHDIVNTYVRNSEYDTLDEYFYFQEGQMADARRGLEQVQGYVCKNDDSAELFYKEMLAENPSLPESVLRFQRAAKKIEKIIMEL